MTYSKPASLQTCNAVRLHYGNARLRICGLPLYRLAALDYGRLAVLREHVIERLDHQRFERNVEVLSEAGHFQPARAVHPNLHRLEVGGSGLGRLGLWLGGFRGDLGPGRGGRLNRPGLRLHHAG